MTAYEAQLAVASRLAKEDFGTFIRLMDPSFISGRFNRYLAKLLQDVGDGRLRRLIINSPPQHGKSRIISQEWPAWLLARNPRLRFIVCSHTGGLTERNARFAMGRIRSPGYQSLFETRVDPKFARRGHWATVQGGVYMGVGVGGSVTGHSADLLVVDDPYRGMEDSHSETWRQRVYDWFWGDAYTRLQAGAAVVILMTRWHVDDLVGRLVREQTEAGIQEGHPDKWKVVRLPALATEADDLGRQPGEPLFPERFPLAELESRKLQMGAYKWAGLYQQEPVAIGGNYLDPEYFKIIQPGEVPKDMAWQRFWDLATSDDRKSDYTVGIKGAKRNGNFYLADLVKGQWKWPEARTRIKAIAEAERIPVGIEAVGGFKTSFSNLREVTDSSVRLIEVGVDSDKFTRALGWMALAESGHCYLVNGPWIQDFKKEVAEFPGGLHDDQCDAVSGVYQLINSLPRTLLI